MENKKEKLILSIFIMFIFIISSGISYAYFSSKIIGAETGSTVALKGGTIEINYKDDSNVIDLTGIYPREEAWAVKEFTLKGINTTDLTNVLNYKVGILVEENTFTRNSLTYTLENTLNEAGTAVENRNGIIYKTRGYQVLGNGNFNDYTNKEHKYILKIYFPETNEDQNENQKARFKGKIIIDEGVEEGTDVAIYVDGIIKQNLPATENYSATLVCKDENNNIVNNNGTVTWNGTKWIVNTNGEVELNCEADFETNVGIVALKNNTTTEVSSNTWSDSGLNYTFDVNPEASNYKVYYCKDTTNTCNPNIELTESSVNEYSNVKGEYYIRSKKVRNNLVSNITSYKAKVDYDNPEVIVTGYHYDGNATNNIGTLQKASETFTSDGTYIISNDYRKARERRQ